MRKKKLVAALAGLYMGALAAAPYETGDIVVSVLERGVPADGIDILVDGEEAATTDEFGLAELRIDPGRHKITIRKEDTVRTTVPINLDTGDSAEVSINLVGLGRPTSQEVRTFSGEGDAGTLSGVVRSEAGEPVPGAQVAIAELDRQATTDADGSFSLQVPRGNYALTVSHPSYASSRLREARALSSITGGFDLVLRSTKTDDTPSAPGMIEEVMVVGRFVPQTAVALERMSDSILDVISEEQIAIAGDSTAADAVSRVTGITVKDDVVVVRGLNERYSATLFNNSELPSTDPTRRAIGLGIFPTQLIGGITVQKTYSADLPGDFSGGAVKLVSKGVPDGFEGRISLSTGTNSESTFGDGFTHKGGDYDFLGYDDGDRDIPSLAGQLTNGGADPLNQLSAEDVDLIGEELLNNFRFNLRGLELPADFSGDAYIGQRFDVGDASIGVNLTALYDSEWRYVREQRNEILADATGGQFVGEGSELERSENTVRAATALNIVGEFGVNHTLNFASMLSRDSLKGTFFEEGFNRSDDRTFRSVTLEFTESQLFTNQLSGQHVFPAASELQIDWQVAYSQAKRDEPGTREYTYSRPETALDQPFRLASGPGEAGLPPLLSWEFLDEDTLDVALDASLPARYADGRIDGLWKIGARITQRDRDFESVRWRYSLGPGAGNNDPFFFPSLALPSVEMILTPSRVGENGFRLVNASSALAGGSNADNYTGEQDIYAGYIMGDFDLGDRWRLQAGVRVETSDLLVSTGAIAGGEPQIGNIDETDVLPSLNLTWYLNDESQVRFGASQTVNRPQFRELSPNPFRDPLTRFEAVGNPDLDQSEITSFDLRYERYFSSEEGFSIAAFYKELKDPLEVVIIGGGSDDRGVRSFANADEGEIYGLELDGSLILDEFADFLPFFANTYVTGNIAYIESEVTVRPEDAGIVTNLTRELQGQSPWVANFGLGYTSISQGVDAILLLNAFGERINEVGTNFVPDSEEQTRLLLDFNFRKVFFDDWTLSLKARNLLDAEFEVQQGSEIQRSFESGREFEISLSYEF